jgi:DNA-binding response OmpR family regulator
MASILVFSDDREVFDMLDYLLQTHGHKVRVMSGSGANVSRSKSLAPDLVMIDSENEIATVQLCRTIRSHAPWKHVRIMIFSRRPPRKINRLLREIADCQLARPIIPNEVLQRVNKLAVYKPPASPENTLESRGYVIDPGNYSVVWSGRTIRLSLLEFRLLYFLASHPNEVYSRARLLVSVWDHGKATPRVVDACIRQLRKKLETKPTSPVGIQTIHGKGYLWKPPVEGVP